jgi:hypothetical protein
MLAESVSDPDPWEPVITRPDPMSPAEWEALLAASLDETEPPGDVDEDYLDPEGCVLPPDEDLAVIEAETDRFTAERLADEQYLARAETAELAGRVAADQARKRGPRGPGLPGSVELVPGISGGPAGGFGTGGCLDAAPGSAVLHGFIEAAVNSGRLGEASEDEVIGLITAADRVEAGACYLKHAVAAELIRRRPAPGCTLTGPTRMPESYLDSAGDEVKWALAENRPVADGVLSLAWDLEVKLPATTALFRDGLLRHSKVQIIARQTALLDPDEARQAENLILDRAQTMSPGALRRAAALAAAQVNPKKAKKAREHGARVARVERWREDSGNAGLAGRELPAAQVLAMDQRITWWARELQAAGVDGGMDVLRVRALTDLLLNHDSRPAAFRGTTPHDAGADHPAGPHRAPGSGAGLIPGSSPAPGAGSGPAGSPGGYGEISAGFAGRNHLTTPLTTLLGLADRPGELHGLGPVDPWQARDLARSSAANPQTTWCLTVTDHRGRATGHACARPEPRSHAKRHERGPPGRTHPPGTASTGFTLTRIGPGPPGGYGRWRFTTGVPGQLAWILDIHPIPTGPCDHRYQAHRHDPGTRLRHLTQIRHATCTAPMCGCPASRADFEHNIPYDKGGRTCLCNGGPKCRHDHRLKQDPRWKVEQHADGTFTWTTPAGRTYTTGPTEYPI